MDGGAAPRRGIDLSQTSDHELLSGVGALRGSERELTARFVAHLAEIEERRLHLHAGFSSLFEFCVAHLRLSEGEAYRRILGARLLRRFPAVYEHLASGAVHLSALELLREHLTDDNYAELLEAAIGKSKREVQMLLARRFPKPDVMPSIRRLPELAPPASNNEGAATLAATASQPARIEPLSEARFKVQFTASAVLCEKLERCRDLMSHANPHRDLAAVIERAVDLLVADLERKRLGKAKRAAMPSRRYDATRCDATPDAVSAQVPRGVRRQVFERDGARCAFVSLDGRRCTATAFLELDHVQPRALGGAHELENVRVFCRAHNQHSAEQVFGRATIEARRAERQEPRVDRRERQEPRVDRRERQEPRVDRTHFRRQKRGWPVHCEASDGKSRASAEEPTAAPNATDGLAPWNAVEGALRNLGFRADAVRPVIATLRQKLGASALGASALSVTELLRLAVLLATAGPPLSAAAHAVSSARGTGFELCSPDAA